MWSSPPAARKKTIASLRYEFMLFSMKQNGLCGRRFVLSQFPIRLLLTINMLHNFKTCNNFLPFPPILHPQSLIFIFQ